MDLRGRRALRRGRFPRPNDPTGLPRGVGCGGGAAVGSLATFTVATLVTFVVLTVVATAGGQQIQWPWLERNGHAVSAMVLLVVGVLVYAGV